MQKWTAYFISDHTGITIESLGKTLLSQFDQINFDFHTAPYIDDLDKAKELVDQLHVLHNSEPLLIFSSIIDPKIRACFGNNGFTHFDLFSMFIPQLEKSLDQKAIGETGRVHSVLDYHQYMTRIEAINFALAHDDGLNPKHYRKADVVLVGLSRSGKTPTCLYLAIQYGIRAANYPLTEEDLQKDELPLCLKDCEESLFGLLIDPKRLSDIRQERLPGSRYASLQQCKLEMRQIQQLFFKYNIPSLNTSSLSIEEIATKVLLQKGVEKRLD